MVVNDGEGSRVWKFAIDGRQAGDFVGEIVLVDEPRFGGHLDQHAHRVPPLAPDVELVTGMFAVAAARRRGEMYVPELIEGRRLPIDSGRIRVRHDDRAIAREAIVCSDGLATVRRYPRA